VSQIQSIELIVYFSMNFNYQKHYFSLVFTTVFIFITFYAVFFTVAQEVQLDSVSLVLDQSGKNSNGKVDVLLMMSRELFRRGLDVDKALIYAQQALLLSEHLGYKKGISEAIFQIANAYEFSGNQTKAREYYLKASQFYKISGNSVMEALSIRKIGNIYFYFEEYEKALEYYILALGLYKKAQNQEGLSATLGDIGKIYEVTGDFDKALENYNQAMSIAHKVKSQFLIGVSLYQMASVYERMKNVKFAIENYQQALNIFKTSGNKQYIAKVLNSLGDIYEQLQNHNKALSYYLEGLQYQKEINDKNGISDSFMGIADLYIATDNPKRAIEYLTQSLEIAQKLRYKELVRQSYRKLAIAHEKLNDYTAAYQNFKLFQAYNDSVFTESRLTLIAEMQTKYDFESKEEKNKAQEEIIESLQETEVKQKQAIELKEKVIRQRNTTIFLVITFSALIIILSAILYWSWLKIRKSNRELQAKNEKITQQKADMETQSTELVRSYIKITDSIRYAETIQKTVLPTPEKMQALLGEYFIISKPKEVVSGDFYWIHKVKNYLFVSVVDCTGHGVSGGLMSMIGHALLNEIILQEEVYEPAKILEKLNTGLVSVIEKQVQDIAMGMELSLCRIENAEHQKVKIAFAGAKRPLYSIHLNGILAHQQEVVEWKGDRQPIGFVLNAHREYMQTEMILDKGSLIYMTSDGLVDQGNYRNKRFGTQRFRRILQENASKSLETQKIILERELKDYQRKATQRDDITVLGLKL
jgi:serine phosphatase RsbU (regulator of sigma subunit)